MCCQSSIVGSHFGGRPWMSSRSISLMVSSSSMALGSRARRLLRRVSLTAFSLVIRVHPQHRRETRQRGDALPALSPSAYTRVSRSLAHLFRDPDAELIDALSHPRGLLGDAATQLRGDAQ